MIKLNTNPQELTHHQLLAGKPCSDQLIAIGIDDFSVAAAYVKSLPYQRSSWLEVIQNGYGTCSSKHAFLKTVADEQGIECHLILGIYPMTGENTYGVAQVLNNSGVDSIPEAHCFIEIADEYFDFTFAKPMSKEPIKQFYSLERITPLQMVEEKVLKHQAFLKQQSPESYEKLWAIREACIESLFTKGHTA